MKKKIKKNKTEPAWALHAAMQLNGASNLTGTQAAGAGVNTFWSAVYDSSYTLHIWFPSSVRTSVGVGNLNAERHVLATNFTFCHLSAPPYKVKFSLQQNHSIKFRGRMQVFFQISSNIFFKKGKQRGF